MPTAGDVFATTAAFIDACSKGTLAVHGIDIRKHWASHNRYQVICKFGQANSYSRGPCSFRIKASLIEKEWVVSEDGCWDHNHGPGSRLITDPSPRLLDSKRALAEAVREPWQLMKTAAYSRIYNPCRNHLGQPSNDRSSTNRPAPRERHHP